MPFMITRVFKLSLLAIATLWLTFTPTAFGQQQPSAAKAAETAPLAQSSAETTKTEPLVTPSQNPEPPPVPGAKTILLKEGQKVPERENLDYEDWRKPELTPGMRMEVVPLGSTEKDGVTRELVSVQWREMDPINLWIIKPAKVPKPPLVIYLYSYPSTNDRYNDPEFCKFLTRNGFAAIGFVSAITGERFHDRARRDWFVYQLQEAMGTSVHDVQLILNYLSSRGDLDMSRVGMWGDGSGASIAIMAAAVDPRIKVLDLLNPWGDWPDWVAKTTLIPDDQRGEYVTPHFLSAMENLEPMKWLSALKTPQVRLQYIDEGLTVTPAIVKQKMEAAAPAQTKVVHYANRSDFIGKVVATGTNFDWIKGQVGSLLPTSQEGQSAAQVTSSPKAAAGRSNQ